MKRFTYLVLGTLMLFSWAGSSGGEQHHSSATGLPRPQGTLAPLLDTIGNYHHPISGCSKTAQLFFDQGLRLYYAFYFPESLASFREAATINSNCPMAYWGIALAISPTPNSRYMGGSDDPQGKGAEAIERAVELASHASEIERGLIFALRIVYEAKATGLSVVLGRSDFLSPDPYLRRW